MEPRCPEVYYPSPVYSEEHDEVFESPAMCRLVDKFCLVEESGKPEDCDYYIDYLNELRLDAQAGA